MNAHVHIEEDRRLTKSKVFKNLNPDKKGRKNGHKIHQPVCNIITDLFNYAGHPVKGTYSGCKAFIFNQRMIENPANTYAVLFIAVNGTLMVDIISHPTAGEIMLHLRLTYKKDGPTAKWWYDAYV